MWKRLKSMKKSLFILLFIWTFLFFGCQKNDYVPSYPSSEKETLALTTWQARGVSLTFYNVDALLEFDGADPLTYAYEYKDDVVMLYPSADGKAVLKGIINGSQMSLINMSTEKMFVVLNKKW